VSSEGSTKAVVAALLANAGIAVAKFAGFAITGSSSLLAEGVHSVADTTNQGLLLLGKKTSQRRATEAHQFGFGRERYFWSFIVALLLFSLGAVFASFEGIEKIIEPHQVEAPIVAIVILLVAIVLEAFSFRTAYIESSTLKGDRNWWQFIRDAKTPELPLVLLEDTGALIGLALALGGVGMAELTGEPVWDGIGTLGIGVLLAIIAVILIHEMKSLLIGESADQELQGRIVRELEKDDIARVIHIRTQYLSPDELLIAAKIALRGSPEVAEVARAIDAAEQRVRAIAPQAKLMYLEPDLDRGWAKTSG
jgi:cation diffusion facilitator family transporter